MSYVLITLRDGSLSSVFGYKCLEDARKVLINKYTKLVNELDSPDLIFNISTSNKDAYIFSEKDRIEISWHIRII